PFLVWTPFEGPSQTWSYARFADHAAQVAGGLAARGVKPGDRVLVHLENCPELLLTLFACAHLGAVCVLTNAMAAGPELAYFAELTEARGVITQPKFEEKIREYCVDVNWMVVTDTDAGQPSA